MSPGTRRCNRLVALTGLSLLVGCSSFESNWEAAVGRPVPSSGLEGPWQGEWVSEANGHAGGLRCVITRGDDGGADGGGADGGGADGGGADAADEQTYHADYHATYWKVFRFGYSMTLTAHSSGDATTFRGEADLGWLAGGVYRYDGRATADEFYCTYESKNDRGHLRMTRP